MIRYCLILLLSFVIIGSVKSDTKPECTFWVNNQVGVDGASCDFTNMCGQILDAFDKLYNTDTTICPNSIDRYIYIVSGKSYTGEGNVPLKLKYFQVNENTTFSVIVQSIDAPTTAPTTTPLPLSATNAVVDAEGKGILLYTQRITSIRFKGITFQNGIQTEAGSINDSPVIIYGSTSSVNFESCVFKNITGGKLYGAIYWAPNKGSEIINCQFLDNTCTGYGGAIHFAGLEHTNITNNIFTNNKALHGGAIYFSDIIIQILINGSTFTNNYAQNGGAIYSERSSVIVSTSTFKSNQATQYGGALYISESSRIVGQGWMKNIFQSNKAGKEGGALYDISSIISYQSPQFIGNSAGLSGGAISFINSISVVNQGVFNGNTAPNGGALWVYDNSPNDQQLLVKDSKFTGNLANQLGGAIYCNQSTARLNAGNIFEKNLASGNATTNDDYCSKTCLTAAKDCGCLGGCGLPPPPVKVITDKRETRIAIAIFLPVTAVLLGVVFFLLYKTKEKSKLQKPGNLSYDEIRLTPTNHMYEKQEETDQL